MKNKNSGITIETINPLSIRDKNFYWRKNMNGMGIWYFGGYIIKDSDNIWWSYNGNGWKPAINKSAQQSLQRMVDAWRKFINFVVYVIGSFLHR